ETFVLTPKIQKAAGGRTIFDTAFMNTPEQMQEFLDNLTEEGRDLFRNTYLTSDNIYPVVYTTFFTLFLAHFTEKTDWRACLPVALRVFVDFENYGSAKMLDTGRAEPAFARFANTMTKAKMLSMVATINLSLLAWWQSRKD
ncbi:MAG: hypothetical protein J6T17_09545, partial [Clostridia bacterium]|nr:hypothetical protein [Clostridia bacterium]